MLRILNHTMLILSILMINSAFAATVTLPRTGQTSCTDSAGAVIACSNTGHDGEKLKGTAWPNPRFTDNTNGTVTDNLTGLIWLKNANCTETSGGLVKTNGNLNWVDALSWSNGLANGICSLSDGSTAGQWRLPNINELESLVDAERSYPVLPSGHPFTSVQSSVYWSSSTSAIDTTFAWHVCMDDGDVGNATMKTSTYYVWPVRAGL